MTKLFDDITAEIVLAIEEGAAEYRMPWHGAALDAPRNAVSGRMYSGINTLLLWVKARQAGYHQARWATYRQWTQLGGQVRRGERATTVLLWKPRNGQADGENEGAESGQQSGLIARAFRVFNANQVDGPDEPSRPELDPTKRDAVADAFFKPFEPALCHGGSAAFYDRASDTVSVPSFDRFVSPEAYYSVLAHELTHWTGAKHRLNRDLTGRFGSAAYAIEELVAELGAAFTTSHLRLACEPRHDHAPYIDSWLKVLGSDPRAIVSAASRAQAAADYLIAYGVDGHEAVAAERSV